MADDNSDDVKVKAIREILFTGNTDDGKVAVVINDAGGETNAYQITPATLRAFLSPMISLAAAWSGDPDFSTQGLTGDQNALVAKQILFARGRNDEECAVRVFLGKDIDFTFLLPITHVVNAFNLFARNVKRVDTAPRPPGSLN